MTQQQKETIIKSGKDFFRSVIIPNHLKGLEKLKLKEFHPNPFLINYLAAFLCGNTQPESLAKALIYPRVLSTSINTIFGHNIQIFISGLEEVTGLGSGIDGIDIEFIDAIDQRKKYCQLKAGPNTINDGDVESIIKKFEHIRRKARLDNLRINFDDLIVGVLYGEESELSGCYKNINKHYPVYCGNIFWEHLTGDKTFYHQLIKAFGEVVEEDNINGILRIQNKVDEIAEEIKNKGIF